jgi:diguanylate cyclase
MATLTKNLRTRIFSKVPSLGRRGNVMLWAIIISFICGVIEFGEPLEDVLRGARNSIRQHAYTGNTIVVGIDDKAVRHFKGLNYSRTVDAKVLDTLFANGAKRVFYDKAFAHASDLAGDRAFQDALKRHRGKLFLGAAAITNPTTGEPALLLPNAKFLNDATIVSLAGKATPFGLSAVFPYRAKVKQALIPSMSAEISNRKLENDGFFRPDWAIQMRTIPTISLVDIYTGNVQRAQIAGRDIVIGPTSAMSTDVHYMASQGSTHGVYFHVVAAETLQKGTPQNWGWLPAWALTALCALAFLVSKNRRLIQAALVSAPFFLAVLPVYLDSQLISIEVVPSMLLFAIVAIKAASIRKSERQATSNMVSGLPNLAALRSVVPDPESTLIALKIRNYSAVVAGFGAGVEPDMIAEIRRRVAVGSAGESIFHEGDTLLWFARFQSSADQSEHLEGLHRMLSATMQLQGQACDLLIAFGVDADHASAMNVRIGSAMMCAQEAVQDNQIWKFYDPERRHESAWELSLLDSVDRAIDLGEFWVAYQPKIDLKLGGMTGAEALVRWSHPDRGLINPEQFIDIAERNNRIDRITAFVLDQAIEAAAKINRDFGPFNIAVNLSVQLLQHPNLLSMIKAPLERHGLPPKFLTVEITETGKIPKTDDVISSLDKITKMGITLSLDDYGTGNATLDHLKLLPFGEVKIDRSFISNITHNEQDLILVKSTISMAHSLGCKVVAEGIETEETQLILARLGCDIAQGYHLGRPMRQAALVQLVEDHQIRRIA